MKSTSYNLKIKKLILILSICTSLYANQMELNSSRDINETEKAIIVPIVDNNLSVLKISASEENSESAFQKASLPMKAAIIVGVPIVAVGAVVYYVVLTPFALVRWAFDSKN